MLQSISLIFVERVPTSQRDRAAVVNDDDDDEGGSVSVSGVRRANNNNNKGGGKKCKKQKYRDYFIEPNGCRYKRQTLERKLSNIYETQC